MPKFNVEVTFDLATTVSAEGVRFDSYDSNVEDFEDNSYFSETSVESDGGQVSFTCTAEDEDEAESLAHDIVADGNEVEDDNGLTWMITNVSVDVEKVEVPMTLERAIEILSAMADEVDDEDRAEAIKLVRDGLLQGHDLALLRRQVRLLAREVRRALKAAAQPPVEAHGSRIEDYDHGKYDG